jgi:hypothetical protein
MRFLLAGLIVITLFVLISLAGIAEGLYPGWRWLLERASPRCECHSSCKHNSPTTRASERARLSGPTFQDRLRGSSWAAAYQLLGALPYRQSAMLYSMNAMTSYGHVNPYLAPRWQMMGALEALNGWILFGLTTAFLFAIVQKAWSHSGRVER